MDKPWLYSRSTEYLKSGLEVQTGLRPQLAPNRSMENVIASRETRPRAFPALTEEQIDRIRPLGRIRQVRSGDILIKPGDTVIPFYVLLSGRMEIVQPSLDGERMIA